MTKVLVVEDERSLNQAYVLVLKKAGYDVYNAFNGEEAYEIFMAEKPKLVLLDLRMPKMSGVDFLRKLRPDKNHPDTRIIVFSNYDEQTEVDKAFRYGASRYILKAWSSPNELIKLVKETLAVKSKTEG